jgi:hypothetical protein
VYGWPKASAENISGRNFFLRKQLWQPASWYDSDETTSEKRMGLMKEFLTGSNFRKSESKPDREPERPPEKFTNTTSRNFFKKELSKTQVQMTRTETVGRVESRPITLNDLIQGTLKAGERAGMEVSDEETEEAFKTTHSKAEEIMSIKKGDPRPIVAKTYKNYRIKKAEVKGRVWCEQDDIDQQLLNANMQKAAQVCKKVRAKKSRLLGLLEKSWGSGHQSPPHESKLFTGESTDCLQPFESFEEPILPEISFELSYVPKHLDGLFG